MPKEDGLDKWMDARKAESPNEELVVEPSLEKDTFGAALKEFLKGKTPVPPAPTDAKQEEQPDS